MMQDKGKNAQDTMTGFETVEGIDPATIRLKRAYEAQVEKKVMSEAQHIIWAYGLIWVIFAAYAAFLAKKYSSLRADLASLEQSMGQGPGSSAS